MKKQKPVKKPPVKKWAWLTSRPAIIVVALAVIGLASVIISSISRSGTTALPTQYLTGTNWDSSSILFDGQDPGEGSAVLYKVKSTAIQSPDLFGKDIYITLGDASKAVVIKTIDQAETLNTVVSVPKNYKIGLTSFHIYYTISNGERVDRWTEVFIAYSSTDYDGDGRPNTRGSCNGLVPDSHHDADHDGLDDACDGYIGPAQN